jgi:hypothetical protein
MRIDGFIPPTIPNAVSRPGAAAARGTEPARTPSPSATSNAAKPAAAATAPGITVEAPPGTDPELWSILTAEERAFFASTATRGPLTYLKVMSPNRTPLPPVTRGGRLDVRG